MPRTREQFKQMQDDRVNSILLAALPLFSLNDRKVSINEICDKAKCSHGIIYHYYKNTDEIYDKLLTTSTYVELKEKILNINSGSSYEKIEQIMSYLIDISKDQFEKACYLNILIKDTSKNSLYSKLVTLIKEGQNSGKIIGGEPSDIVNCVFVLLKGIYLSFITEKHPNVKVPSLENLMQLIRKPLSF